MKKCVILLAVILMIVMMFPASASGSGTSSSSGIQYSGSGLTRTPLPLGSRTLKFANPRMRGQDVKNLQIMLRALGYNCGYPDGIFGEKTRAAVKNFQSRNGLKVDGIVGYLTKHAIQEKYSMRR